MRILEVGTGSVAVTLVLARGLGADGRLLAMEPNPKVAAEIRTRLAPAGCADRVSVIVGEPQRFLHKVRGPFDAIVLHPAHDLPATRQKLAPLLAPGGLLLSGRTKYSEGDMTTAEWLAQAKADAEQRGLPELIPMLDGLAQATERLRAADWNDNPDPSTPSSAAIAAANDAHTRTPNDDD
ncbi:MAG: methyltransferase domain-containing protein [Acidimicrobiia bacterium]|nr:methyltransferase domain-containing protein [Acidimicrobiia bacterium]